MKLTDDDVIKLAEEHELSFTLDGHIFEQRLLAFAKAIEAKLLDVEARTADEDDIAHDHDGECRTDAISRGR